MNAVATSETFDYRFGAKVFVKFTDEACKAAFVRSLMDRDADTAIPPAIAWSWALGKAGYVSQGRTLLSGFSVRENVCLPLLYRGDTTQAEIMARANRLCAFCSIATRLFECDAGELGVLEQIQASFLQATVAEPDLLVLDAVFEGISPTDQARVAKLIFGYQSLFPLRPMLYLGYTPPPPDWYAPTAVLPQELI